MKFVADYFNAEKFESLFFIGIGFLAIGLAVYFWLVLKEPFYRGVAIPLVLVAFIQLTVGITVYLRSLKDIKRLEYILKNESAKIQTEEMPRMETVMKNFIIYRYVEIGLAILGLLLFLFFPSQFFWKGVGIGLLVQASFMLSLDYFAEKRGHEYIKELINLTK